MCITSTSSIATRNSRSGRQRRNASKRQVFVFQQLISQDYAVSYQDQPRNLASTKSAVGAIKIY